MFEFLWLITRAVLIQYTLAGLEVEHNIIGARDHLTRTQKRTNKGILYENVTR